MEVCVCFCYNKMRATIKNYENSNTIKTREGKNMETMQGKKNIVLIGMPGAGKSTVGVVLAKRLGYRFLDSDLVIQEQTKKLLHELITEHGVDGFLKIEEDINAGLDCEQAVIATGGSVIYGEKAMEHLCKIGCVVYLKLSYKEIEDRLGDLTARGVALKNGQTLKDLYNERCPLYEKYAHIVQECDHKRVREIVQELTAFFSIVAAKSAAVSKLDICLRIFFIDFCLNAFGKRCIFDMADAYLAAMITGIFKLFHDRSNKLFGTAAFANRMNASFFACCAKNRNA